jgi:hypothetical protein
MEPKAKRYERQLQEAQERILQLEDTLDYIAEYSEEILNGDMGIEMTVGSMLEDIRNKARAQLTSGSPS